MVKKLIPEIQKTKDTPEKKNSRKIIKQKKEKQNRLQGNNFFLTFPQCKLKKEKFMERLLTVYKLELNWIVTAEENHKDGTPHLHVAFNTKVKSTLYYKKLDEVTGKRGNYQAARNIMKVVDYITKDNAYLIQPDTFKDLDALKLFMKSTAKMLKSDFVATEIEKKKSIYSISKVEPGFTMMNLKKIQEYESFLKNKPGIKLEFRGFKKTKIPEEQIIKDWFKKNVLFKRKWTDQHLFIHGKTQMGKTTFIRSLEEYLNIYYVPMDEEFYDFYSDEFNIIVFEEFKSQKTIQFLNRFMDGFCTLKKKGAQIIKVKPLPCIFLSNYHLDECFSKVATNKPEIFKTIERRLLQVEVNQFISLTPRKPKKEKKIIQEEIIPEKINKKI